MLFASNIDSWTVGDEWGYTASGLTGTAGDQISWATQDLAFAAGEGFDYSARVTLADGAGALAFGIANNANPAEGAIFYKISKTEGLAVIHNGQELFARDLTDAEKNAASHVLKVVYENGEFKFCLNGEVEHTAEIADYSGGAFALAIQNGSAGFNYIYAYRTEQPHLDSFTVTGAALDKEYNAEERSYYADVVYSISSIDVKATFDSEKYTVYFNGTTVTSEQEATVYLNSVGYNVLSVKIIDNATGAEKDFYVNVNRWPVKSTAYDQALRPQYHFTPITSSYMNDPNGLIYNSYTGEYHMFYQYHAGIKHGYENVENSTVSWGHAVSRDLVSWEELPLAVTPDELGLNFSGSAVIDRNNVSGLFDGVPVESRMIIYYASAYGEDQSQGRLKISIAYSRDNGVTWIKYGGNPVVKNPGDMYGGGLRDPSVFWYEDDSYEAGGIWVMLTVGLAHWFVSEDLINWEYSAPFTDVTGTAIDFECPDVFQLAVDGNEANKKWVVTGGGVFYILGHFERTGTGNGVKFVAETPTIKPVTPTYNLAAGLTVTEHYATQTFSNMPDGRAVSISWLIDTTGLWSGKTWQGAQGIALENKLVTVDGTVKLVKTPIAELNSLRGDKIFELSTTNYTAESANPLSGVTATVADINASIVFNGATKAGFIVRKGGGEQMVIYYDVAREMLVVDKTALDSRTSKGVIETEMHLLEGNRIELRILLDNVCYDVFGNNEAAVSGLLFTAVENNGIEFFADGDVTIENIIVYSMNAMKREMDSQIGQPNWTAYGSTTYENGVAQVANGGSEDTENYLGINLEGDYTVTAKVEANHYAGMQLRTSSGYMFIRLNVAGKTYSSYGNIEGNGGIGETAFEPTDNMYIRMVKSGKLFETYLTLDGGESWIKVYSYESNNFAFSAYEIRLYSIGQPATFSNIILNGEIADFEEPVQPEQPDEPEAPVDPEDLTWTTHGEVSYENGVAEVTNGGDENTANYLGINLSGNYTVTTKIEGIHYIGMQLRTSSGYMFIRLNVAGKTYCSYGNIEPNGGIGDTAFEPTDNMYLRMVKNGNLLETYFSLDGGASWTKVYSYESENFSFTDYEIRLYSIGQPATFSEITVEQN